LCAFVRANERQFAPVTFPDATCARNVIQRSSHAPTDALDREGAENAQNIHKFARYLFSVLQFCEQFRPRRAIGLAEACL
jgi:hypothetical protein